MIDKVALKEEMDWRQLLQEKGIARIASDTSDNPGVYVEYIDGQTEIMDDDKLKELLYGHK